jgi:hypothetical protein
MKVNSLPENKARKKFWSRKKDFILFVNCCMTSFNPIDLLWLLAFTACNECIKLWSCPFPCWLFQTIYRTSIRRDGPHWMWSYRFSLTPALHTAKTEPSKKWGLVIQNVDSDIFEALFRYEVYLTKYKKDIISISVQCLLCCWYLCQLQKLRLHALLQSAVRYLLQQWICIYSNKCKVKRTQIICTSDRNSS